MNPNLMGPGKLPTDFTNINIPSVFTEGITVAKKIIKTTQKKKFIPLVIPSVKLLVNCQHYSSCQLQKESSTEHSVSILQRALELFTSQLHC